MKTAVNRSISSLIERPLRRDLVLLRLLVGRQQSARYPLCDLE